MDASWLQPAVLAATETPGVGPEEVFDYWPILRRLGWFLVGFAVVFVLGWFVLEPVLSRIVRRRNRNNPTIDDVVTRWIRLLVAVVATLVGVAMAGFGNVVGDSAIVVAAATLAIGVAGQTVIGSLVSGMVLVADPEFNVGNYVEWTDGAGTIQSITLRTTRIVTPDGELVTVPNTTLTDEAITRPFGRQRSRVVQRVGVDYDSDVDVALEEMLAVAEDLDVIADEPSPDVHVESFEPDLISCRVHFWVADPNRRDVMEVQSAYAREVKRRLTAAGIDLSPSSAHELSGRIEVEGDA